MDPPADRFGIGGAIGDLGRHTKIGPDGLPILTHHTEVFLIVSLCAARILNVPLKLLDRFCLAIDPDVDLRIY